MNNEEKEKSLIDDLKNQNDGDTFDFKIPEHLEKKNIAYSSILLDLQTCEQALKQLKKKNKDIIQTSLFTTIIILYGKCFTDSSSSKFPKLELKMFEGQESRFKILHTELMNMRHNYVAHRGMSEHEFGKAYFQINPKTMKWGIKVGLQRRHSFELEEIPEYLKLIEFLLIKVQEKYDKVGQKVINHMFENILKNGKGDELEIIKNHNKDLEDFVMNYKIRVK